MPDVRDDASLVRLAQSGDRGALATLLQRHELQLFNTILRMVSNRDDAAELTQQTMVKVIQNLNSFEHQSQVSTWMTRIAMNEALSHLRKRKVRRAQSLEATPNGEAHDDGERRRPIMDMREPEPSQRVETNEMVACLQSAIDQLDEPFRAVLVLRDLQQMEYRQIAEVLELSVGTVKSRLFRARTALREQMQCHETPADRQTAE